MSALEQVATLDPSEPAPPVVVDVDPGSDMVGHGRTLPLVGGQRPHVYDAVFADGSRRVYADTVAGVLSGIVEGYADATAAVAAAEEAGDPDAMEAATASLFETRHRHADALRVELQTAANTQAQADGAWDTLDEEEREQCTKAAEGLVPIGVLYAVPMEDADGSEVVVDKGFWTHPDVRLVINRGDYDLFDPDFTPEPESLLSEIDPETGKDVVYGGRWPSNMVILDPTDEDSYLESLEHAGLVEVTVRPVDLPDDLYLRAVATGREIQAAQAAAAQSEDSE